MSARKDKKLNLFGLRLKHDPTTQFPAFWWQSFSDLIFPLSLLHLEHLDQICGSGFSAVVAICLLQIKPLTRPERSWNLAIITPDPDLFVNNRSDIISQDLIFQSQRYFCHMVAPPPQQHGAKSTNWCLNNWTYVVFFNIFFLNICFLFSTFVEMPFIKWLRQLEMWCQSNVWILLKCWNLLFVSWRELWIPKKLFWSCRCSNTWWTRKNGCGARGCELCERLREFFRSASEFAALALEQVSSTGNRQISRGLFQSVRFHKYFWLSQKVGS